ncbi:hypothetical protein [Nonomuraea sp. NPDC049709]|uniref:hypothetical protein n=1 Tax=Nonomuraea sp. NPDC049709 TaxID=3154736 RepID=UPI00343D7D0B
MGQALRRLLLAITITLLPATVGAILTPTAAQAAIAPTSIHVTTSADDDDDEDGDDGGDDGDGDDDGGAPRGGVDTGVGGAASRDDDDDDDGAPRGGVDTGVGGAASRDDDDDDDGAPRGGVDTGMGGTASDGTVGGATATGGSDGSGSSIGEFTAREAAGSSEADEGGAVPLVPLSLAGAGLFAVGAYWLRRTFFARG